MVALVGWLTMVVLRRPVFFAICVGLLCAIASLHMLDQHRTFYLRSEQQQTLGTELANTLHGIERGNAVIMLDESEERELASILGSSWTTQNIVRILYEDYQMGAVLCYPHDTESWGGYSERRRFDDETATVLINDSIPFLLRPYDQIIVVRYTREDGFTIMQDISSYVGSPTAQRAYQPDQLLIPNSDLPPRILTLFGN